MSPLSIVILSLCGIYMLVNFTHDLHMLQQNSYRADRYFRWLKRGDMSSAWRLVDVAMIFLVLAANLLPLQLAALIVAIVCTSKIFIIFSRKFKKPLVYTKRIWRLYCVTALLSLGAILPVAICNAGKVFPDGYTGFQITLFILLAICALSWVVVLLALFILSPVEKAINRKFRKEAVGILQSMPSLKVIGITGSYGKTSTKHFLHSILSEQFETLMTPGSFNTPLGVIRTVREQMKPYTEIFICEMGAKQKGDIKEICDIVNPEIGIITAVGPMHLESFKSLENVQSTKFELADALPSDGFAVVNDDFALCASRKIENTGCIRYSAAGAKGADYVASDIRYSPQGTDFKVTTPEGEVIDFHTPVVGEGNVSNILAAIIVALKLGMPVQKIVTAVGKINQVEHRLSMRRTPGGVTVIDDAFNSNPSGAKMALDVLTQFTGGQRIVVTPGMIELGEKQHQLNAALGKYIGDKADVAIIVGEYNRDALTEGLAKSQIDEKNIYTVDTFVLAQELLTEILRQGDTILYENDLPDSFK